jgi:hypothetical protein
METNGEALEDFEELSHHAGFDARLCYGDITLGFRFFPTGLPESILRSDTTDELDAAEVLLRAAEAARNPETRRDTNESTSSTAGETHKWEGVNLRHGKY